MLLQKSVLGCVAALLTLLAVNTVASVDAKTERHHLTERPNVVVILVDNVPAQLIGAYGNQHVKTPNIDQLAAEGLTLENAFATSGVCSPTRATLLTGLLPSQNGVHNALPSDVPVENWSAVGEYRNLPQTLSEAGYNTGLVGKYHLGAPDQPQMGFESWVTFASGHTSSFHNVEVIDNGKHYRTEEHITDYWTQKAVEFIEEQDNTKPFFLYLSYNGPYMLPPLVLEDAQNRHAEHYRANPHPLPNDPIHPFLKNFVRQADSDANGGGEFLKGWRAEEKGHKKSRWSEVAWGMVQSLNNPIAMVHAVSELTMVDDGVGAVMESLKSQGLDENTLVIFTSDQGASLGEHGLWGNSSASLPTAAYDENMHVPLIVRQPQKIAAGVRNTQLINQFDIAPTVLDYVGMADKTIASTAGRSFVPLMQGRSMQGHDAIYFEYMRTRAIRTQDWKWIQRFPDGPNELYDLRKDPGEYRNLVDQADYAATQKKLAKRMEKFFDRYAKPEFNVWRGGSAKAVMEYGGRNDFYRTYFPDWKTPSVSDVAAFSDKK